MNKLLYFFPIAIILIMFSCKDDSDTNTSGTGTNEIVINELVANGSLQMNEFGDSTDWVELYNPNSDPFTLEANKWLFSDANNEFTLSQNFTIAGNGHLVVYCDGRDTIANQIHTNFKLTAAGDEITVKRINDSGSLETVDNRYYFNADSGDSYGRYPDGADNWEKRSSPTIGSANVD